ncbi:MAG: methionine biosynthesis protein MetW [Desulfobacula sp.]|jgi:methionine biosynthesis protein MetW|uniref:methionine biosynthesis protein MetW n=1 Tax=Desulfobacula sp. TaxID=2593537 RepID=UPI001D283E35|nr:methionine biosynthesis protein MetW [Desulfobacula sp.]MBT3484921.1 methionine biosynthesis protein MetW [Desulfobacula sp.]MBT3803243.1 methionine biosynthesis protein MetW [Desulfobacula sp.]MBT4024626.1 methionine biosynthesis protein MetW [Desulfobacula sp.]MBT4197550.1 methionine biosynthesis protein MetW [Desulfobacula sp.]
MKPEKLRYDLKIIASWIEPESKVLGLGCGEGDLLYWLKKEKNVQERGIEIEESKVVKCIEKGISVLQGDINEEMEDYPDNAFDYAICSQTLQQVYEPSNLIHSMMRIAKMGVVSFPNFGHINVRMHLAFTGRAPVTRQLPYSWHDTPNIRVLSLNDFQKFSNQVGFKILKKAAINTTRTQHHGKMVTFLPNLFATYGIFLIGKE